MLAPNTSPRSNTSAPAFKGAADRYVSMTPATQQLVVLNRLAELCRRRGSIRWSLREGAFGCADHLSPQRINFLTAAAPSAHGTGYALPSDCLGRVPVTPASDIQLGFGSDQRRGPVLTEFVQSAAQCGLVFVQENRHIAPGHFTQQAVARRASPANRSDQPDRAALPRGTNPRGLRRSNPQTAPAFSAGASPVRARGLSVAVHRRPCTTSKNGLRGAQLRQKLDKVRSTLTAR